jgi:hypothetical protein
MKSTSRPRANIHKQQLFHWIGRDIDRRYRPRPNPSDDAVTMFLGHLRGSLENGLWVKTPEPPEHFRLREQSYQLRRPITCFTEWSLGDSLPHTTRYGRLGFGFSKRWVIERGGQPVTYFRHSRQSLFLRLIFKLVKAARRPQLHEALSGPDHAALEQGVDYLLHFAKSIRNAPPKVSRPAKRRGGLRPLRVPVRRPVERVVREPNRFARQFGRALDFVEEREWRIVHDPDNPAFVTGPGSPPFYLRYEPGEELFTLVLPDNKTVSRVLRDSRLTARLFPRNAPHVTLLSLQDIGTF